MRYKLLCESCGRYYPVETRQAGGTITCECGAVLSIPTMLKMKRLPEWDEEKEGEATEANAEEKTLEEKDATADASGNGSSAEPSAPKKKLSAKRRGLFCFCGLVLILSLFVVGRNIKTPDPTAVFYKETVYSLGDGRMIKRDSTPITMQDYGFYFSTDFSDPARTTYLVNDGFIDGLPPFQSILFFDYVRELNMSDNFYDKYDSLIVRRRITMVFLAILAGLSLVAAVVPLFLSKEQKTVGAARGSDWKS